MTLSRSLRYLGVDLDSGLSFTGYVKEAAERASTTATTVARLKPNVGGPSFSKRKILMNVVISRLLYATPTWAERALASEENRTCLIKAYRLAALSFTRVHRTISDDAALFLAGITPADLAAEERARIYEAKTRGITAKELKTRLEEIKSDTLQSW